MIAVLLMVIGAVTVVAGFAWIWPPLALIAAGAFLIVAGVDLSNRPPRGREAPG
jgi:hypothetical protein